MEAKAIQWLAAITKQKIILNSQHALLSHAVNYPMVNPDMLALRGRMLCLTMSYVDDPLE